MCPGHKLFQVPNENVRNPKIHQIQKSVKYQKSNKSKNTTQKILVQKS